MKIMNGLRRRWCVAKHFVTKISCSGAGIKEELLEGNIKEERQGQH
jgi:hypothetical protein